MSVQHLITPETTISERLSDLAPSGHWIDVLGKTIDLAYEVPDSDRREIFIRFENGPVLMLSCDPAYDEDGIHRLPDQWETVLYDVSETEAGRRIRELEPGHWL